MKKSQDNWVQQWGILVNGLRAELVTWKDGFITRELGVEVNRLIEYSPGYIIIMTICILSLD